MFHVFPADLLAQDRHRRPSTPSFFFVFGLGFPFGTGTHQLHGDDGPTPGSGSTRHILTRMCCFSKHVWEKCALGMSTLSISDSQTSQTGGFSLFSCSFSVWRLFTFHLSVSQSLILSVDSPQCTLLPHASVYGRLLTASKVTSRPTEVSKCTT